jgi:hypothetical protein
MSAPPTPSTPSNLDMAEPCSMDDFGQTYRSTGILVSHRLSLPITVVEPSVVRWRWKLGEGEQMHFTVTFTAATAVEGALVCEYQGLYGRPAQTKRLIDRG